MKQSRTRPLKVKTAKFIETPEFALRNKDYTQMQKKGLRYEKQVKEWLSKKYGESFLPTPWIGYVSRTKQRACQPDGILCCESQIIICEVKLSHRPEAENKLRNFYAPIVQAIYPDKEIFLVQITRGLRFGDKPIAQLAGLSCLKDRYSLIHWVP